MKPGSKKHILFISSWYPNKNNSTHGIFNRYFAEAVTLNNQVSVLHVSSNKEQSKTIEIEQYTESNLTTIQIYYKKVTSSVPILSNFIRYYRTKLAFAKGYKQLVKTIGTPDLIHLNVAMPAGLGVLQLAKKYKLPYVVNENWSGYCVEDGNYKGFLLKYFTKKIMAQASAILPTSEFLKRAMLSHELNGNYHVVPNPVNADYFIPQKKLSDNTTTFIHVSSLTDREKNVSGIIRAFSEALKRNKNMLLHVVGDGSERELHQRLVAELHEENHIKFKGRLLGQDLVNEINASDALVMFSHFETFCLVIIEAFACGRPVITSNAGAIKDYMQPQLGIMVNKNNEPELTQAFLDFANKKEHYDLDYTRRYAVDNYSYQIISQKLDAIYDEVLKK